MESSLRYSKLNFVSAPGFLSHTFRVIIPKMNVYGPEEIAWVSPWLFVS